jgi:hypothetical protein
MKMLTFFSFFLMAMIKIISCEDQICGGVYCNLLQAICVEENSKMICVCRDEFDTFPLINAVKCNYRRKSKVKALLLELFLTYGAGHFYSENYKLAIPKFLFWVFTYYGFIVLKAIHKGNERNKVLEKFIKLLAVVALTIMLSWQVIDLFLFGFNIYSDGNGIEMV